MDERDNALGDWRFSVLKRVLNNYTAAFLVRIDSHASFVTSHNHSNASNALAGSRTEMR